MWVPFILGLASSLHCAGMCGGIVMASTFQLAPRRSLLVVLSNLARITSYGMAGGLLGGGVGWLSGSAVSANGHNVLSAIAAVILIVSGLQVAGWVNLWSFFERPAGRLWQVMARQIRACLPMRRPLHALMFGAIWGWLPCGMVYNALALAATSGDGARGALYMLSFGAGTLPAVIGMGLFASAVKALDGRKHLRWLAASVLIAVGTISLAQLLVPEPHDHRVDPSHSPSNHHQTLR